MARTLYEILEVGQSSTAAEIRSAHRKLVLKYHPDRSNDPRASAKFLEITQAYETLGDAARRKEYDRILAASAPKPRPSSPPRSETKVSPSVDSQSEVMRLTVMFSKGNHQDAERLARKIVRMDPRQAVPYAILGDLARSRGELKEASKMFAFAIQMDPDNVTYNRRYEELLSRLTPKPSPKITRGGSVNALACGGGVVVLSGTYIALSNEQAYFHSLPLVSSWTLGLLVMTFISGVALGASLAAGEWMDRFGSSFSNSLGRPAPWVALATIAIASFWVATGLYVVLGAAKRSGNVSTSRLIGAVVGGVCLFTIAAAISPGLAPTQVFLWSGNLMYIGAICGWMATDALRGKE